MYIGKNRSRRFTEKMQNIMTFWPLTWCDGDGDGVCVAASTRAAAADVAAREH